MDKKRKPNVSCFSCGKAWNIEELEKLLYVDRIGDYITFECPACGQTTYICNNIGMKSHKIN